jgi:hypothetical protein
MLPVTEALALALEAVLQIITTQEMAELAELVILVSPEGQLVPPVMELAEAVLPTILTLPKLEVMVLLAVEVEVKVLRELAAEGDTDFIPAVAAALLQAELPEPAARQVSLLAVLILELKAAAELEH